jgi:N4-gp56 family major capsid protein
MFDIFDIQRFAEGGGALTNTTTQYVNSYTGATTAFAGVNTLTPEMKTYYDTELLENARPEMIHAQFGRKQSIPKGRGKSIEWRKFNTLANAAVLVEGVIPTGQKLGVSFINDNIDQYGTYVSVSDMLELTAIDPVILEGQTELSASAGRTQDELTRNDLMAGTNVIYAQKNTDGALTDVASRSALTAACKLTPDTINRAVTALKKMNAPTINGDYVAIIHPSVAYDLRASAEWLDVHKYAQPDEIFNGEIGKLHGVRFVETTQAKIFKGGSGDPTGLAVYATLVLGKDAYGVVDVEGGGLQMIVHNKTEAGGPLDQFSTIGYKLTTNGAKILYEDRMVRIESCSTYSATDVAN